MIGAVAGVGTWLRHWLLLLLLLVPMLDTPRLMRTRGRRRGDMDKELLLLRLIVLIKDYLLVHPVEVRLLRGQLGNLPNG